MVFEPESGAESTKDQPWSHWMAEQARGANGLLLLLILMFLCSNLGPSHQRMPSFWPSERTCLLKDFHWKGSSLRVAPNDCQEPVVDTQWLSIQENGSRFWRLNSALLELCLKEENSSPDISLPVYFSINFRLFVICSWSKALHTIWTL